MDANLRSLKKAHRELMTKYVDILNDVSKLPFFVRVQPGKPVTVGILSKVFSMVQIEPKRRGHKPPVDVFVLPFLVRLFVEAHIRAKLIQMSLAYSYLAQKVQTDKAFSTWLEETSEQCDKIAATLTSWQSIRGIVSVWWPVIIGIIGARLEIESIYEVFKNVNLNSNILVNIVVVGFFPSIYFTLFISSSFGYKRDLFMPGFYDDGTPRDPSSAPKPEQIVYFLEDRLFALAGRGKSPEIPVDVISRASGLIIYAVYLLVTAPNNYLGLTGSILSLILAGVFLFDAVAYIRHAIKRKWN